MKTRVFSRVPEGPGVFLELAHSTRPFGHAAKKELGFN